MKENVLKAVYELVDEIKEKNEYKKLLKLKKIIDTDKQIIKLVEVFNKTKVKYNEVSKYGEHHPDLKEVRKELSISKEKLFTNEIIKEYKQLEKEIQNLLDDISRKIAKSVSPKIKHPNEIGLINK